MTTPSVDARREILNGLFPSENGDDEENQAGRSLSLSERNTDFSIPFEESVDKPCAICFESLDSPKPVIETCCNHIFHRKCLLTWMADSNHDDCPSCRHAPLYDPQTYQEKAAQLGIEVNTTTAPEPTSSRGTTHRIIYWIFLALVFQLALATLAINGRNDDGSNTDESSSFYSAMFDLRQNNDTSRCDNVYVPLDSLTVREQTVFCLDDMNRDRSCSICGEFTTAECLCYCSKYIEDTTIVRYARTSQCCQCSKE